MKDWFNRANWRRPLLFVLGSVMLISGPGLARPTTSITPPIIALPSDLAAALDAYNQATIKKDTLTLAGLVTDDYMLVNSDGSVQDKRSYLADFDISNFSIDPYKIEQPVLRLNGNTALTGGFFKLSWMQDGRCQSRRLRIAHFWNRKDRKWRISYTQLTRVPE